MTRQLQPLNKSGVLEMNNQKDVGLRCTLPDLPTGARYLVGRYLWTLTNIGLQIPLIPLLIRVIKEITCRKNTITIV